MMRRIRSMVLMLAMGGFLVASFSCTQRPNEEQIRVMEETRSATLDAEKKLEELKQKRQQMESELAAKKDKAGDCDTKSTAVEQRVSEWQGQ